jgi:uncharacterized protein YerC
MKSRNGTIYYIEGNGESYVGQTYGNPGTRWSSHINDILTCKAPYTTCGGDISNWKFSVLEVVPIRSKFELDEREMVWVNKLSPTLNTVKAMTAAQTKESKYQRVKELLLEGKTYRQIRDEVGVSLGLITRISRNSVFDSAITKAV